jgi:Protein of unknown function (DUF2690)
MRTAKIPGVRLMLAAALILGTSLAATAAASAATGSPSQAAHGTVKPDVLCYGNGCNGQDPIGEGCSADAQIRESITLSDGSTLQVMGSPACGALWARLIYGYFGDEFWICAYNGYPSPGASCGPPKATAYDQESPPGGGNGPDIWHTDMVSGVAHASTYEQACWQGPDGPQCTAIWQSN